MNDEKNRNYKLIKRSLYKNNHIKKNALSIEQIIKLDSAKCVKVSKNFFALLIVKYSLLKQTNIEIQKLLEEYIELQKMHEIIDDSTSRYILMRLNDLKRLIKEINISNYSPTNILKSNINIEEFDEKKIKLQKEYLKKLNI